MGIPKAPDVEQATASAFRLTVPFIFAERGTDQTYLSCCSSTRAPTFGRSTYESARLPTLRDAIIQFKIG